MVHTCSASPELHSHGDVAAPLCRIDADVPRHNRGTQPIMDDAVVVRVGLEVLQYNGGRNNQANNSRAGSREPAFCLDYLHSSVVLVLVEGDVVLAVGDIVFLHPVTMLATMLASGCSPLCVDSRHPGHIPKVHLQPLVEILFPGIPRPALHSSAADVQPGVRGPVIPQSF